MPSLGPAEILVILVVALLVLGPSKLPEAGRQVGRALAEFRRWSDEVRSELGEALSVEPNDSSGPWVMEAASEPAPEEGAAAQSEGRPSSRFQPRPPSAFPDSQSFT